MILKTIAYNFLLFLCLICPQSIFAGTEKPFVQVVIQEEPGQVHQYYVIYQGIDRKTNQFVHYYWHRNGKHFSTQGGYSGNLLHGAYEEFDKSGRLKIRGHFHFGAKDGIWKFWNRSGAISGLEYWKNGFLQKKVISESDSTIISYYRKNQQHGRQIFTKEGKTISKQNYRNGKIYIREKKCFLKWPKIRKQEKINMQS